MSICACVCANSCTEIMSQFSFFYTLTLYYVLFNINVYVPIQISVDSWIAHTKFIVPLFGKKKPKKEKLVSLLLLNIINLASYSLFIRTVYLRIFLSNRSNVLYFSVQVDCLPVVQHQVWICFDFFHELILFFLSSIFLLNRFSCFSVFRHLRPF